MAPDDERHPRPVHFIFTSMLPHCLMRGVQSFFIICPWGRQIPFDAAPVGDKVGNVGLTVGSDVGLSVGRLVVGLLVGRLVVGLVEGLVVGPAVVGVLVVGALVRN